MTKEKEPQTLDDTLKSVSKEVVRLQKDVDTHMSIETPEQYQEASTWVISVNARLKRLEDLRLFFTKPLNDQVKAINAKFKEQSAPLAELMAKAERGMKDYKLAEMRKSDEIERKEIEKRRKENEKRIEEGREIKMTPIKTPPPVEMVAKSDEGQTTTRKVWLFRVVDINLVPREYLRCEIKHSEVMGLIDFNGVREIAGLEIYEDVQIIKKRN